MQDRLTYANGNTITTEGFHCSIGEPIDIKVTVDESEDVDIPGAASKNIPDGDYFITLEVNGEKAAYRDLHHITYGGDTITIGDYTISDDLYLYGVSEDDEVVMRLEPVELTVTDEFRAAVGAVAPKSGGSGGGVLAVHEVDGALDKTYKQIVDALHASGVILEWTHENGMIEVYLVVDYGKVDSSYLISFHTDSSQSSAAGESHYYIAESENGYPTNDD